MPAGSRPGGTGARDGCDYGILGVGEIGAAIVTGLCGAAGDDRGADADRGAGDDRTVGDDREAIGDSRARDRAPSILLSPRSADRAAVLAARYPSVSVAAGNQEVVDRSAAVILSVRPKDGHAVLRGLRFRPGQAIISAMAGVPHGELKPLVAPARDIARVIPMPAVGRRAGITPVHPGTAAALALFGALGEAIAVADVGQFEAMSAATGTVAAHLRYVAAITGWLSGQGVPPGEAERYIRSIFADVGTGLVGASGNLDTLARAHATPGGINERFAAMLADHGVFDAVGRSLQDIYDGLRR